MAQHVREVATGGLHLQAEAQRFAGAKDSTRGFSSWCFLMMPGLRDPWVAAVPIRAARVQGRIRATAMARRGTACRDGSAHRGARLLAQTQRLHGLVDGLHDDDAIRCVHWNLEGSSFCSFRADT